MRCVGYGVGQVVYEDANERSLAISRGVTYGGTGDGKVRANIGFVLGVISNGMPNERVIASQVEHALDNLFEQITAAVA